MFEKIAKILKNKEIRKKLIQIILLLIIFRVLSHIPLPGINVLNLKQLFEGNQLLGIVNILTGSGMKNFSIVALAVGPYITASIIVQLLAVIIPKWEKLSQEGEQGQNKLNQYTRWLTVPFAFLQGYAMLVLLKNSNFDIVSNFSLTNIIPMLIILTAGTMLTVWIGEIISEKKIGNGMSWIIFAGIISGFLSNIGQLIVTFDPTQLLNMIFYAAMGIAVVWTVVFITEAQRNIPIIYARQFRNGKSFGGDMSYLPIRVNQVGMVPIIFAVSVAMVPSLLSQYLATNHSNAFLNLLYKGSILFSDKIVYAIFYFALVIFFTYFYTSLVFKADKISENLNKQGAYIPGVRPGKETENYLTSLSSKIVFTGAMFLGVIAILPNITEIVFNVQNMAIGGSSLLIVVGVVIETVKQLEAYSLQNDYEDKYAQYSLVKEDVKF